MTGKGRELAEEMLEICESQMTLNEIHPKNLITVNLHSRLDESYGKTLLPRTKHFHLDYFLVNLQYCPPTLSPEITRYLYNP